VANSFLGRVLSLYPSEHFKNSYVILGMLLLYNDGHETSSYTQLLTI